MSVQMNAPPMEIIRSNRRTISIEVRPSGIIVRAPRRMSSQEISAFVLKKKAWIEKHWSQMQERQQMREQQGGDHPKFCVNLRCGVE